jgi:hypothetical protein
MFGNKMAFKKPVPEAKEWAVTVFKLIEVLGSIEIEVLKDNAI